MSLIFDEQGLAISAGTVTVFNYDAVTYEYVCSNREYLHVGVGIPAYSALDNPLPPKLGFAVCRKVNNSGWEYLPDHRGEVVYSTETGKPIEITMPGAYPDNTTPLKPKTPHDYWDDTQWVTDIDAVHTAEVANAEAEKIKLLSIAQQTISIWQTQLQLGMISDSNKQKLIEWMKYIEAVQAVDTNAAPNITWPVRPEE
ncbi:MAG: tail fiber assembly protein [Plesiomonas sp.]|uniref:tail fiber assembly protein n=1 Tax=Plesiomonas sp. TaxID=2486279 RepID=UPI003F3A6A26